MFKRVLVVGLILVLIFGVLTCGGGSMQSSFPWILFGGLVAVGIYLFLKGR